MPVVSLTAYVCTCTQIHGQAVHLLQVLPSGRLVKVQQFGRHCWDDDELILSEQAHAEQLWRSSQVHDLSCKTSSAQAAVRSCLEKSSLSCGAH